MADTFYECMFLFNANAYARNPAAAANTVEELIKTVDGEILASRLWNEQKLAYQSMDIAKALLVNLFQG